MSYRIAGIDVHKKLLAVVVSGVEIESEYQFEQRWFGSNPEQLRSINHACYLADDLFRWKRGCLGNCNSAPLSRQIFLGT